MTWIALQPPTLSKLTQALPQSSSNPTRAQHPTPPVATRPTTAAVATTNSVVAKLFETPDSPAADESTHLGTTWEQLADWALQFNPHVVLIQAQLALGLHQAVLIDARSSLRLWGGLHQLLQTLAEEGAELGLSLSDQPTLTIAHGPSGLAALAALWSGIPAVESKHLDTLSLRHLPAASVHLQTLSHLGCNTWGQLRAMPRGGITRRFGRELLQALDTAYGLQPESYRWRTSADEFCQGCDLLTQVETATALMFGAQRLLKLMQAWLRARQFGVIACEFVWCFDLRRDGPTQGTHILRTAHATQDLTHLQRLLLEHLQRMQLPAPVHRLQLKSLHTEAFVPQTTSLLPEQRRPGDALHHFIERLGAKLGAHAITRPQLLADHRPERMQQAVPAGTRIEAHFSPTPAQAQWLPTWLLREPLKLMTQGDKPVYQGTLKLLQGPQRIETSSLIDAHASNSSAIARDYFIAWSEHAGLLWIYRNRTDATWFLHGLYA